MSDIYIDGLDDYVFTEGGIDYVMVSEETNQKVYKVTVERLRAYIFNRYPIDVINADTTVSFKDNYTAYSLKSNFYLPKNIGSVLKTKLIIENEVTNGNSLSLGENGEIIARSSTGKILFRVRENGLFSNDSFSYLEATNPMLVAGSPSDRIYNSDSFFRAEDVKFTNINHLFGNAISIDSDGSFIFNAPGRYIVNSNMYYTNYFARSELWSFGSIFGPDTYVGRLGSDEIRYSSLVNFMTSFCVVEDVPEDKVRTKYEFKCYYSAPYGSPSDYVLMQEKANIQIAKVD